MVFVGDSIAAEEGRDHAEETPREHPELVHSLDQQCDRRGFNSRTQFIKSQARGIRNFRNYRSRIVFYCAKNRPQTTWLIATKSAEEPSRVSTSVDDTIAPDARSRSERLLGRLGIGRAAEVSLRAQSMRGSIITLLAFGSRQAIHFVSNLVLAWMLFPSAFGLMALVQVILASLKMFSDVGIGPSIIQHRRGDDPVFLNTAWTAQALRGVVLWAGASALAWPAARLYGVPELALVLPVAAFSSVIAGLNSTSCFTLPKKLAWGPMAVVGLTAQIAGVITMIAIAWWFRSVWALVAGWYAQSVVMACGSHLVGGRHRHRFVWDREYARELFTFGRWIFISSSLTFLATQFDRLALGRLLTLNELGVYGLAMSAVMLPSAVCGQLAWAVLFPALSHTASGRPEGMASRIRTARNVILPGSMVATLCVVFGAPVLFGYVYDDRYSAAAWMVQGLSLTAWFSILQRSTDRALLAVGDSRSLATSYGVRLAVTASASLLGFRYLGLGGFMLGLAIGALAGQAVVQWSLWGRGIRLVDQDVMYTAIAAGLGAIGVGVPHLLPVTTGTTEHLLVLLGIGFVCIVPLAMWAGRRVFREVFTK
jgi:O-antigen/teichoic acid export membrane protein